MSPAQCSSNLVHWCPSCVKYRLIGLLYRISRHSLGILRAWYRRQYSRRYVDAMHKHWSDRDFKSRRFAVQPFFTSIEHIEHQKNADTRVRILKCWSFILHVELNYMGANPFKTGVWLSANFLVVYLGASQTQKLTVLYTCNYFLKSHWNAIVYRNCTCSCCFVLSLYVWGWKQFLNYLQV